MYASRRNFSGIISGTVFVFILTLSSYLNASVPVPEMTLYQKSKLDEKEIKAKNENQKFILRCLDLTDTDSGMNAKDLVQLRRLTDKNNDAKAVYARYLRKCENNPLGSLSCAGSVILSDKIIVNWEKMQKENYEIARADWQKKFTAAQKNNQSLPEKPSDKIIHAEFPDCAAWSIGDDALMCASEAACALAELNQMKQAFAVCERIGTQGEGVKRLEAYELYAEIRAMDGQYKDALAALNVGELYAKEFMKSYRNENPERFKARLARYQMKRQEIKRLSAVPAVLKWFAADLSPTGILLQEMSEKIKQSSLSEKEYTVLRKLMSSAETARHRAIAAILTARCVRTAEMNPHKALLLLIPLVTDANLSSNFVRTSQAEFTKSMDAYKAALKEKKTPPVHPQEMLHGTVPPFKEWNVNADNGCAVPEIAATLSAMGKSPLAAEILTGVREKLRCADWIESGYAGALIFIQNNDLKKAESFCKEGIKMIPNLETTRSGKYLKDKSGIVSNLKSEFASLERNITYRMETARYGEGFVLYRNAEIQRIEKKNFVQAYPLYQRIIDIDSGVYREAATAYSVKCLLNFATKEGTENLTKYIEERSRVISQKLDALNQLKKSRPLDGFNRALENSIVSNQRTLNQLKSIPTGDAAMKEAINIVEKSLAANEFGLYRGEMLMDIALFYTEEKLDFVIGEKWFVRADEWFEKCEKSDISLEKFAVTGDAAEVTAPPPAPRYKDQFGNVMPSAIKPGVIFNRKTADWYVLNERKQIVLYLGLFAFSNGKREQASAQWERLGTLDPFLTEHDASVYNRLKNLININSKSLSTPEIAFQEFKKQMRNAILLADINYQFEDWEKSKKMYKRIYSGKFGKLSKDHLAAAILGYEGCLGWLGYAKGWNGPTFMEKHLTEIAGAKMEPMVLLGCANYWSQHIGKTDVPKNCEFLCAKFQRVLDRCPNTEEAEAALFSIGYILSYSDKEKSIIKYMEYLKKYPQGRFSNMIKERIKNM